MLKHAEVFAELRDREFARLNGHAYLDYTGSALYGESQIRAHHALLEKSLLGNPHAEHSPSRASADVMNAARDLILRFLDVDSSTHDVCFTANATAAIKLVAESYPFGPETSLVLSVDNHNAVNGMREYARRAGAAITYLPIDDELRLRKPAFAGRGLFAFPAQSNFSGVCHPLSLVQDAHDAGFDVLLDAAAFLPTHALSLRECPADFVALSFYKLFGYPTGLGALVARHDALARLRRPWFSGGTVLYASVLADTHRLRPRHEAFEDGTPDFLGIAALPAGFALLEEAGMDRLTAHVASLTEMFIDGIRSLRHRNGRPVARIYGPLDTTDRGGAIAFNLCDPSGEIIPYTLVESQARDAGVSVRCGCFCNPGASEVAFGLDAATITGCFDAAGDSFTIEKLADCVGKAVGAVRVSIGLANNAEDIRKAVELVTTFRR
jgi:selenocysteine lyase/cysteine desulfurase